ncbi:related to U3 small nucleolar RNA-associated protein 25 [Saccharomycodes ludwigii]|uniref:U3 small nucleolar RNA-associated protein 25 n=1 Tax=Saccharomycodes ludwigii TaxID=36035 RepID=A0A376B880_9ASCO|nr:hypothetical protein SCDLUD_002762 [Saccharomycodes ludwigii]KAH3901273.1 hypothetical protein SCDLUD_002762 [Saccharomycodes ludwigii]SSD60862.1 related to U3 small nucleolar RNA-associated protein 25 [Saccharomycodes ludwigii]
MSSKYGRKELRTIRRSGKRHHDTEYTLTSDNDLNSDTSSKKTKIKHVDNNTDEKEEHIITEAVANQSEESPDKNRPTKVYNALLTLLNTENEEDGDFSDKIKNNNQKQKKQPRIASEHELLEEAIEDGYAIDAEEDNNSSYDEREVESKPIDDDDDDDDETNTDFFNLHFNTYNEHMLTELNSKIQNRLIKNVSIKIPISDKETLLFSKPDTSFIEEENGKETENKEKKTFVPPKRYQSLNPYVIKQKLKIANSTTYFSSNELTDFQKNIVDPIFQYNDLLCQYDTYGQESQYRDLYALHALNHIYKTRDKILKNNSKSQDNPELELLDQGFTRPKVLIVAPTRNTAYEIITNIIRKSGIDQIDKRSKFQDQFYSESSPYNKSKPKSFQQVFKGNSNDFFILGLKFTRKAIKLYANFYQSDIIVTSPLGLFLLLQSESTNSAEKEDDKQQGKGKNGSKYKTRRGKKNSDDFLSSIELLIVDQLHVLELQNFDHLYSLMMKNTNNIPKEQHENMDFSRIRMWYIDDLAKLFRQTLIFTKYITPNANLLINRACNNIWGKFKTYKKIDADECALSHVGFKIRQIFQRFDFNSSKLIKDNDTIDEPDYRFKYFTNVIIPKLIVKSTGYEDGILIYIPDYSDYIRLRNYIKENVPLLFDHIDEYASQSHLSKARNRFRRGKVKVLLYTERLHYYRRYELNGVKSVIFYKPPTDPEFYSEVVRFIGTSIFQEVCDANISNVRCIYSKFDGLSLSRIVGSQRAAVLTHGMNEIYEFR